MKEKTGENLICELCKRQFSCGAKAEKCWCFEMDLESEALAKLRENFKSCLCEDCLGNSLIKNNRNWNLKFGKKL